MEAKLKLEKLKAKHVFATKRKEVFRANRDVKAMENYAKEILLIEEQIKALELELAKDNVQAKTKKQAE